MPTLDEAIARTPETSDRALAFYNEKLKSVLEPEHLGKFIALEPDSGEYAIGPTTIAAAAVLHKRLPGSFLVTFSIGPDPRTGLAARMLASRMIEEAAEGRK